MSPRLGSEIRGSRWYLAAGVGRSPAALQRPRPTSRSRRSDLPRSRDPFGSRARCELWSELPGGLGAAVYLRRGYGAEVLGTGWLERLTRDAGAGPFFSPVFQRLGARLATPGLRAAVGGGGS
jgi:hypothetical protein